MKPVTCYLERLSVRLYPSLEEFEEELLDLLNSDRLLQVLPMRLQRGKAQCTSSNAGALLLGGVETFRYVALVYLFCLESPIFFSFFFFSVQAFSLLYCWINTRVLCVGFVLNIQTLISRIWVCSAVGNAKIRCSAY